MKALCIASFVALALLASWQVAEAGAKDPSKFYVRMTDHHIHGSGAVTDNLMRFSVPVEIPRAVLPAGTYLFEFVTPTLVRVTDLNRTKVYATFTTMSAVRTVPPNRGTVRFQNRGGDSPVRLIAWFLYGNSSGSQPLYPKAQRHASLQAANTTFDTSTD
jgi:hypothetical protein